MSKANDKKALELIKEVEKRKQEIAKIEKPNWQTNCTFSFTDSLNGAVNLHVETSVVKLVSIVAFLLEKQESYGKAVDLLGVEVPEFSWGNYPIASWIADVRSRIAKIQIGKKRDKLEALLKTLNSIISPELKAQMALDQITAELE